MLTVFCEGVTMSTVQGGTSLLTRVPITETGMLHSEIRWPTCSKRS